TVHARSAAAAFSRLIELGADPHSVASAVTAVLGQRLVRVLCPDCKQPAPPAPGGGAAWGPVGCPRCEMKGFRGRRGIFEILELDEATARMVAGRSSAEEIRREAAQRCPQTLYQAGMQMVRRGETTLTEVWRVTSPEADAG
ncbi:MAG TPA: type II/IV secretion system protein, partial [Vicinamibacteria bacterium]